MQASERAKRSGVGQAACEIALIFAVFFLHAGWHVPSVNEPHYLTKAKHFWDPGWLAGDFFMESPATHWLFYASVGWITRIASLEATAWIGRIATWMLLAWAWRRLSRSIVPRPWMAVLSAGLWVALLHRFELAGEWVVGGCEAKGFAYVLCLLALESLVRNQWGRVWILLGAASGFHVLVGGWTAIGAICVWALQPKWIGGRPTLGSMLPPLALGAALSLPGLVPALAMNWGADGEVVRQAHRIYVGERLAHHLLPNVFSDWDVIRHLVLWGFWLTLCRLCPFEPGELRLRLLVAASGAIMLLGFCAGVVYEINSDAGAALLRYYLFRLSDVMLPLGVAMLWIRWLTWTEIAGGRVDRVWFAAAAIAVSAHLGLATAGHVGALGPPQADRVADIPAWRAACLWIRDSGQIPPDARFLVPRWAPTFKWFSQRSEAVNWKDIPQDAANIVEWRNRIDQIYRPSIAEAVESGEPSQFGGLPWQGADRLNELGEQYGAQYVIANDDPPLALERLYANRAYVIYRLP